MSEEKILLKKSVFMFLTNGIGKSLLVLANILMARLLGAEVYGEFIYVFAVISIIPIISRFGLDQGLLKFIPQNEVDKKTILNKSISSFTIVFTTVLSLLIILLLLVNLDFFTVEILGDMKYKESVQKQVILIFMITATFILAALFQARGKMGTYSIALNLFQDGFFLFGIILLYLIEQSGIDVPILAKYIGYVVTLTYLIFRVKKNKYLGKITLEYRKYYIEVLRFSFPLMLIGSLSVIIIKINIYMVGYYMDDVSVGIYNSAAQVAVLISFMLMAVNQVFAPMISTMFHKGELIKLNNIYSKINYFMVVISLILMSFIVVFSELIMNIFGSEFIVGATTLIIIAGGQIFNAISGPCGYILTMTGFSQYNLYINILMLILIVILSIFLIPNYGIEGAALSSAVSIIVTNISRMFFMYKKVGIVPFVLRKV